MTSFKDDILSGRSALVAGGTSGINLEIAKTLARFGAKVAVMSRKPEKVDAAVAEIGHGSTGYVADVRDYAAVETVTRAAATLNGPLSIVVSGAAGNFLAPAAAMSANAFKTVIDIDLLGTFNVLRASFEVAAKPGCSMINISAPQSTEPYLGQAHACAAKAGVDMLTRVLALEWGSMGIRVNAIVPGPIDGTEGMARLAPTPHFRKLAEAATALKRMGSTSNIADMAVFLASDASSYVTGTILNCDGGMTLYGASAMSMDGIFGGQA